MNKRFKYLLKRFLDQKLLEEELKEFKEFLKDPINQEHYKKAVSEDDILQEVFHILRTNSVETIPSDDPDELIRKYGDCKNPEFSAELKAARAAMRKVKKPSK